MKHFSPDFQIIIQLLLLLGHSLNIISSEKPALINLFHSNTCFILCIACYSYSCFMFNFCQLFFSPISYGSFLKVRPSSSSFTSVSPAIHMYQEFSVCWVSGWMKSWIKSSGRFTKYMPTVVKFPYISLRVFFPEGHRLD